VCRNSLDPTNATCTTSLSCTGSIPAGSMMCPATLTNVANPWHNVGPSALSCISGGNCEYYTPPALFDCGLSVPPGFYKCPGTIETGLAVAKNWGPVGTCNVGGSCEYIACPGALCSPATLTCSAGICGNKYQTCTSSAPIGSGCADPCTASSCTGSIYCPCNSGGWREIQ
jgi:hypothetical protein